MLINLSKTTFIAAVFLSLSTMITVLAQTQEINNARESKGRTVGTIMDVNDSGYKAIKNIRSYIKKGDYERAESRAVRFLKTEDREKRSGLEKSYFYNEAHNCLCLSLTGQNKIEEAMEACNQSLEYSPKHWESLKSRAILFYLKEDFPKSLEDFTSALENAPEDEALTTVLKQNINVIQSKIQ